MTMLHGNVVLDDQTGKATAELIALILDSIEQEADSAQTLHAIAEYVDELQAVSGPPFAVTVCVHALALLQGRLASRG